MQWAGWRSAAAESNSRGRRLPFVSDAIELAAELTARFRLSGCTHVGRGVRVFGAIWLHGEGDVWIGDRVVFDATEAPIELSISAGSTLRIGDDSYIGGGTAIEAQRLIVIGARAKIGTYCKLLDNHQHHFAGIHTEPPASTPTVVEDDVVLGTRSILLAGAYVGARTTVEPDTVIKQRIPAGVVVGGIPSRVRGKK